MSAYLSDPAVGYEIRERVLEPLRTALLAGDEICLAGHSMGTMLTYDVLWSLSHDPANAAVRETGRRVQIWLTLGSALGEPGVPPNLIDSDLPPERKHPRDILSDWVNIAAHDDYIAHRGGIASAFGPMIERGDVELVRDLERIHTFWCGAKGANPHKLYGYLDHPAVAQVIADWIMDRSGPGARRPPRSKEGVMSLAARVHETASHGFAHVLLEDVQRPEPGPGQVRVRMSMSPINPSDHNDITGTYTKALGRLIWNRGYDRPSFDPDRQRLVPAPPYTLGREGVGVVEASGGGWMARRLVGKRVAVAGGPPLGTWQNHTVVDARRAIALPRRSATSKDRCSSSIRSAPTR